MKLSLTRDDPSDGHYDVNVNTQYLPCNESCSVSIFQAPSKGSKGQLLEIWSLGPGAARGQGRCLMYLRRGIENIEKGSSNKSKLSYTKLLCTLEGTLSAKDSPWTVTSAARIFHGRMLFYRIGFFHVFCSLLLVTELWMGSLAWEIINSRVKCLNQESFQQISENIKSPFLSPCTFFMERNKKCPQFWPRPSQQMADMGTRQQTRDGHRAISEPWCHAHNVKT